ncbi:MAG: DMT family transporter [Thermoplasmata archaeon]|nr:MAG: DMT family transporter [Thermoplasmata archaeon]
MGNAGTGNEADRGNNTPQGQEGLKPETRSQPLSGVALFGLLFAVFCWGLSFPLIKEALDGGILPITLGVLRYFIGLIPLFLYLLFKKELGTMMKALREDWKLFLALGIFGITVPNILQNFGMLWTSAHVSSVIQASGPIFTIMLAVVLLREPLGLNKMAGAGLAILGTLLLITEGGVTLTGATFLGNMLVLLSAVSYAFSSILSKKSLEKYEPLTVAILSMMIGTPCLAVFWVFEDPVEHVPQISPYLWFIVIVLAILPGVVALLLWYVVLKTREVSRLILFIYLIPVFATVISYFFPGELIKVSTVFFAALTICGVMIAQYEKQKKEGEADQVIQRL